MRIFLSVLSVILFTGLSNSYLFISHFSLWYLTPLILFLLIFLNILPFLTSGKTPTMRLRFCAHGVLCLKIFLCSVTLSVAYHIFVGLRLFPEKWYQFVISALICIFAEAMLFWNGIISVYCTSVQLGIKHRVVGILCGMIPLINIAVLLKIIKITGGEVRFESEKINLNRVRGKQKICKTKYPVLLVHGVFFRDFKHLNYWGRIPDELIKNGAMVYYGNQQSAASVADSGRELADRIREIVRETNCEKVNIIAHSKGGLDSRYAARHCDVAGHISSIITINTPHKGCEFADYLLNKIPDSAKNRIANTYNSALKRLGDKEPNFISAVTDLTAQKCKAQAEEELENIQDIYCRSIGSRINRAASGKFPLNLSYRLVKHFDGPNDGLVSEKSFRWSENYLLLSAMGKRGISHADMIDLNRENIPDFDVREFYVQMVADLKNRGL